MKYHGLGLAIAGLACLVNVVPGSTHTSHSSGRGTTVQPVKRQVSDDGGYGKLDLSFEPNKGQFASQFRFGSRGLGYAFLINASTLTLNMPGSKNSGPATALNMTLDGANDHANVRGGEQLPGFANYFHGDPKNWITHVPTFQSVVVENAYPGINVVYYGNQSRLEYDFVVRPHGSPESIALAFPTSNEVAVDGKGDLVIHAGDQEFRQSKPIVYQEVEGRRVSVNAAYVVRGHNRVAFQVGRYDKSRTLIIDPQLVYSTFSVTRLYGIATDSAGNAYVCGADSLDPFADIAGATDAIVFKLNADGTAKLWSASFGTAEASDSATAIAVDASGNAFVTGFTSASLPQFRFPTTTNAIQPNPSGSSDAFVTEFDTNGNMVYSTYLGGGGNERGDGIAIDSLGNIYVAGRTNSSDFPTAKAYQPTIHGSGSAFVTVLNASRSAFIYSTYLGGSGSDAATAIAVDATGSAYVTGWTNSTDFPTRSPIRPTEAGGFDTFVLKLNPAGSALMYGTYTGGSGDDIPTGIAIDSANNAYVSGTTNSPNFPTVAAFQSTLRGGFDAFVTKVNAAGTAFAYSTYLGGSSDETIGGIWCEEKPTCGGITVNSSGNAYVTGITASSDFPQLPVGQTFKGVGDAFVTEMSVDGSSLIYSTLLGGATGTVGAGGPFSSGTAVAYLNGNLYLAGLTNTSDFPTTDNSDICATSVLLCVNPTWNGISAFVAKLSDDQTSSTWTRVEQNGSAVQYSGSWSTNTNSNESGGSAVLTQNGSATFTFNGTAARWIGFTDPWSGIANVYVDGVLKSTVDTYSSATKYQVVQYTITGLAAGNHTLKIQATGQRNSAASSAWVWVDAFDFMSGGSRAGTADFSLTITPSSATVLQGGNISYAVSAMPSNGFSGTISLTASGFGPGTTGTFNPSSIGGSGSSTLLVTTTGNTPTGAYAITVTGASGSISHSVTVSFNVNFAGGTTVWSRVEQSDANIHYTSDWNSNSNGNESGGSAYLTLDGSATFTFSGTGARWIGFSDPWSGIANVFVDGSQFGSVDTYSSATKYQAVQYTITGLSSGTHTLKIQATGQRNPAASAAWIWLDAFDFTVGSGGGSPDFTLNTTGSATVNPGGSTTYTVTVAPTNGFNSTVSLTATGFGSGASASFSPSSIAGSGAATLTVTTTGNAQTGTFSLTITGSGGGLTHSVTVTLNVNSTATPSWTRIEQTNSAIQYSDQWYSNTNSNESGGSAYLALSGAATLTFSGTAVRWIGFSDPWSGIANVYIDGALKTQIDTFSTATKYQVVQYTITGLAPGTHTIRIEATGQQDSSASSPWVWLDGFDIAN